MPSTSISRRDVQPDSLPGAPSRAGAEAVLEGLSEASILVALVYGAVAPCALGITKAVRILARADARVDGRRLDAPRVRECYAELEAAGVVVQAAEGGRCAVPDFALPLTRLAHASGCLVAFVDAYRSLRSSHWYDPAEDDMTLRTAVVAGDMDVVEAVFMDPRAVVDWRFLAEPLAVDLLDALPETLRQTALDGCLNHVVETAAPAEAVLEACWSKSGAPWRHAPDIAFVRVLQGRFDDANAVFAALPPDAPGARSAAAATRALIALLRDQDEEAWRALEETLDAERAGTRKRMPLPRWRAFALALLALVRIDTPIAQDLLERVLRSAGPPQRRPAMLGFVANAAKAKAGGGIFGRRPGRATLDALLDGLTSCWLDDFHPAPERRRDLLRELRDRAAANGFAWLAAECNEVLRCYAARHENQEAPPSDEHARLGTTTLAVLAAPVPDWEYSLKALERVAHVATNRAKSSASAPQRKTRLAWLLDIGDYSLLLEAREQRQNKNGSWGKGRRIGLRRLATEAATMDFLLPQDRAAIAAMSSRRYYDGGQDFYLGSPSLYALAGHPHVVNAEGESVDVVRRPPELVVDESDDGSMVVQLRPFPFGETEYHAALASSRRCEVTRFEPTHAQLLEVVPEEGLTLPIAAKPRLLEAVASLASDVRVQSAETDRATPQVDADPDPWVQLEPLDAGLTVALVVEPIADSGIGFEPGIGGSVVFANRDGERVQAKRDLDAERQAVDALVAACPELAVRPTEFAPLALPEPTQCLELLERLESANARCKWPKGQPFRIVANTPSLALAVRPAQQWLRASGQLAVDEERVLDLQRLFELLETNPQSRFLELGDGEFLALSNAFRRQLDDLSSLSTPAAEGEVRLHRLAALAIEDLLDGADLDADDGWRDLQRRLRDAESFEPAVPSTLQAELRPYQVEGYRWLARLSKWGAGACLADDMGLGKTVQTLAVLLDRAPEGPALVVAPTSVVANWREEARRFAPTLNVKVYAGAAGSRTDMLSSAAPFDLFVTTYGVLQNDIDDLAAVPWHSAVLDEAQAIKNPSAKRTRAARRLPADFRVVTTGTPIQNNLFDLHSLFNFLNPGLLGSLERFRNNFALPIERDEDADAQSRLRRVIAPFVLRRLKANVLDDLPERTEITLHVAMSEEEASLYEALRRKAVEDLEAARLDAPELGEGARRVQVLAHLTKLRLACCNPRLVLDGGRPPKSSKLATFAATLEELLAGRHKVLVFSQFVMHLKLVEEHLQAAGVNYQYLDGSTPAKARAERIAAFQAGEGDVFLISLKAGGVGLNLTAADYVIHMDPWWNPAVEDQASDRAHRIGQTRPVTIYRLVTEGTIEEQIVELHHHKRDLAEQLLEGTDATGRLDAEQLLELLRQPLGG